MSPTRGNHLTGLRIAGRVIYIDEMALKNDFCEVTGVAVQLTLHLHWLTFVALKNLDVSVNLDHL